MVLGARISGTDIGIGIGIVYGDVYDEPGAASVNVAVNDRDPDIRSP